MSGAARGDERPLFEYLLRLADDRLVLGHRLSEWCGHGPILEEDIALTNISLDCIGQAQALLDLAGRVEGDGRSADDLAYFRGDIDFRNALLVEQPNGDFAMTTGRQFLFDCFAFLLFERLSDSRHEELAAIAAKSLKEIRYHLRHSGDWIVRLGDGTEESHRRMQKAIDDLWIYTDELFEVDAVEEELVAKGIAADASALRGRWDEIVSGRLEEATLSRPEGGYRATGGRRGHHTEHLGHMLSEMQILARSHPGAEW